jgi:hypothetical protein
MFFSTAETTNEVRSAPWIARPLYSGDRKHQIRSVSNKKTHQ